MVSTIPEGSPRRRMIRIIACPDSFMWYRDLVGKVIPFERVDGYGYWAREGGVYNPINYVRHEDCVEI